MDDIPYVGFVDPHTKSNGSNDHVCFFHQECILIARTLLRIHAGMIRERFDTVCFQDIGKLFHLLTAQTIDNTWFPLIGLDIFDDLAVDIRRLRTNLIIQIRTVEGGFKDRSIDHSQVFLDIVLHFRSGCRSQGYQRTFTDFVYDRTDTTVFRAEIMSPFGNTMCFVHCIKRNIDLAQKLHIFILGQGLRSHIEQLRPATADIVFYLVDSRFVQGRVYEMSNPILFAEIAHGIYLVFHQGYQGRNHNGRPLHHKRRQLITQRFSSSGRHQYKSIISCQHIFDDCSLISFKGIKTKMFFELFCQIILLRHTIHILKTAGPTWHGVSFYLRTAYCTWHPSSQPPQWNVSRVLPT